MQGWNRAPCKTRIVLPTSGGRAKNGQAQAHLNLRILLKHLFTIMNFINLATLNSTHEAERLADALSHAGIKARTHDESDIQRFIFLAKPKAFSIVQVLPDDYAQAVGVIQDMQDRHEPLCRHIFSCPDCGSLAVEYPQFTRKYFITPLLLEWASNLGLFNKKFYCRKCHAVWPYQEGSRLPVIGHAAGVEVAPPN